MPKKVTVIAITGTPGTGKSSAALELARIIHAATVIDAGKFARKNGIVEGFDARRKSWIVDTKRLKRKILGHIKSENGPAVIIVEGHYSEEVCTPDVTFVLRCRPDVLEKRLLKRKYTKEKLEENILAEALDYCTISACNNKTARVYELDSTMAGKKSLARTMARLIASKKHVKKYSPRIDYSGFLLLSRKR